MWRIGAGLLVAALMGGGGPAFGAGVCRVIRVVDGDTLQLDCGQGARRVRLLGFDTPEIRHPRCAAEAVAGRMAGAMLTGLVASAPVTGVQVTGQDRYGRDLASLAIGGQDVALFMLGTGLALPYQGHAHPDWCARLAAGQPAADDPTERH